MDLVLHTNGLTVKLTKPLILVHLNIRSLISKIDEITVFLSIDKISPQVLCLISIENYSLGSNFSRSMYQNGGVCTFINNDVCFSSINLLNYYMEKNFHTVNFPIRSQINHASATDNGFVDTPRLYSYIFPLFNALSDHDAQCLILNNFFVIDNINNNKVRNKSKTRLIMDETINYFTEQLLNETWEEVHHNTDVNSAFNYFLSTF
jgi:hypothetical protein